MNRVTIGKRVVVYGGEIKLICPRCRRELPPEQFHRSGPCHTLHRRSWCMECVRAGQVPRNMQRPRTGRPVGRPKKTQAERSMSPTKMATVEEARARAKALGWTT